MAAALLAQWSFAQESYRYFVADGLEYTVTDAEAKTVEVTKWLHIGNSEIEDCDGLVVDVPATVTDGDETFTVTSVADRVFGGDNDLIKVTLPNTIKGDGIGIFNFVQCPRLETVVLPEGLTKFNLGNFVSLPSLKQLTLPEGLESLAMSITSCGIESLRIPSGVTSFGWSLSGCESLSRLEVGTMFSGSIFMGTGAIRELRFSEGSVLLEDAFPAYPNLERVILSKGCFGTGNTLDGSMKLRDIVCEDESVLMVDLCPFAWAADKLGKNVTLWVPEGSSEKFAAHRDWKRFTIKEGEPKAPVGEAGLANVAVDSAEGAEVWTLDGIFRGSFGSVGEARDALTPGIYVVKASGTSRVEKF